MLTKQQITRIVYESFAQAEKTCTVPWVLNYERPLPGTSLILHQVFMILAGVAGIINITIALYLLQGHYRHWTKPTEQRQCTRIIWFVIIQTLVTFFAIMFYNSSGFIEPPGQYYEGLAIISLFLLYIELSVPDENTRASFFHGLEHRWGNGKKRSDRGSLHWFRRIYWMVFQIALTRVATVIADEALFGDTCPLSKTRAYGSIAITVIQGFSTGIAVTGVILFENRMREHLDGHMSFFKLVSFKGVVGLQTIQEIVFTVLEAEKVLDPSYPYYHSYNDYAKGLQSLILIWELTIVAIMFLRSFEFRRYQEEARNGIPVTVGPARALLSTFTPRDIGKGLVYGFTSISAANAKQPKEGAFGKHGSDADNTQVVDGSIPSASKAYGDA